MKVIVYKLKNENKVLRLFKDDSGWYYIAKMPMGRDNIFASVAEIEIVLDIKLESKIHWEKEV